MGLREEFIRAFEVPPIMQPHIDLVADELEMRLVVALGDQAATADKVTDMLDLSREEASQLLKKALLREIIFKDLQDGVVTYTVTGAGSKTLHGRGQGPHNCPR